MARPSFARGGYETRYDKDGGGNHIEAIRNQPIREFVFINLSVKKCTVCGEVKPKKGGTRPTEKWWKCAECKVE